MKTRHRFSLIPCWLPTFALCLLALTPRLLGQATLLHQYIFRGDANDSVGSANGTLLGGASASGGKLSLNGAQYVQFIGHLVPTSGSYSVTLFAQALPGGLSITELISQGFSTGPGFYLGYFTPSSTRIIRATDSWQFTGVAFPTDGQQHHYAFVVDATANQSRLYLDGVLMATLASAITTTTGGTDTRLGRQFDCCAENFHGTLSDVRIYSGALDGQTVAGLASGQTGTIQVTSNLGGATFSIKPSIPGAPTGGPYPVTINNALTGTYTVTFYPVAGYVTPAPSTQNATAGVIALFTGNYAPSVRPAYTTSYYVPSVNPATLQGMGAHLAAQQNDPNGAQDAVVVLFFGAPTFKSGAQCQSEIMNCYGVAGVNGKTPLSTVATLVESFITGYYTAPHTRSDTHARIVISTSNSTTSCSGNQVTSEHGAAFATMVNTVASWVIGQNYDGAVAVAGGNDIELDNHIGPRCPTTGLPGIRQWAGPQETTDWVNEYFSVTPQSALYDVGDAAGCPNLCGGGWTGDEVLGVAWGFPLLQPIPQIYNSVNASTWARLSLLAHQKYGRQTIGGSLTEFEACVQNEDNFLLGISKVDVTCDSTDQFTQAQLQNCAEGLTSCNLATPIGQGWQQLSDRLNQSVETSQTPRWSTDVKRGSR